MSTVFKGFKGKWFRPCILIPASCCICVYGYGQNFPLPDSSYKIVIAGKQYATSPGHQKKWGAHYRKEWNTPVKLKIVRLDTLAGGLTPYQEGGGRQSKTLRLRNSQGKEYVLRSIDKTLGKALPEITQGTFLEEIANDQVSIAHPYAALTIPILMKAAGIYHTLPQIVFVPKQPALGEFNDEYGEAVYLFEQRPDENWEEASNFGNPKNIIGTEKLLEKLREDNQNRIDQPMYAKARLMDMLIGDWGRHEDQWRWAEFNEGSKTIYRPIPRDRDQAFTKFDGTMVSAMFSLAGLDHLQSFDYRIEDVRTYNYPARHLDRMATNEITTDQWVSLARELQQRLPDSVIYLAIKQLPPEVFPISGPGIIDKLISRRDQLPALAADYGNFLAEAVDIPGSDKKELFEIAAVNDAETEIRVYNAEGNVSNQAFYKRSFSTDPTSEVMLYGRDGNDIFIINGKPHNALQLRLVPGNGRDSLVIQKDITGLNKTVSIYDNNNSGYNSSVGVRIKISKDTVLNNYKYAHFEYDEKGMVFRPGITLGLGYRIQKQQWRKHPFGIEHLWMGYYGPNRGSVAFEYRYILNHAFGKWNMEALGRADFPLVANFYGIGNETTVAEEVDRRFYRYQSTAFSAGLEFNRLIDSAHTLVVHVVTQSFQVKDNRDRFISKENSGLPVSAIDQNYFARAGLAWQFKKSNHAIVPTKGFEINLAGSFTQNLRDNQLGFASYSSSVSFYQPLFKTVSVAIRAGGAAITGKPEFYQLATLSGKENLRGYRRQRFYGKTSFYNNNELRWIVDTRNRIFNGKLGLLAFIDQGRVWQPGEISDSWHIGYGGGLFIAPFNKILLNATYGFSSEDQVIHMRIGFLF